MTRSGFALRKLRSTTVLPTKATDHKLDHARWRTVLSLGSAPVGPGHIRAEIGEILIGTAKGRTSKDEITLFKSLGLAVEDLASAQFLFEEAKHRGSGTWVEF